MFERFAFASEIVQHLQADKELDPDLRAAAVRYVQARGDSPSELNTRSRDMVKSPAGSLEDYRKALKMAEAAARITPWDLDILNTLGVAQYRAQDYADALATLERCENKRTKPAAKDLALIAMAHFKLGHAEQARSALDQVRRIMKDPDLAARAELQSFLHEAESLIGSPQRGKIN